MDTRLKIYTDKSLLGVEKTWYPMLFPFWGSIDEGNDIDNGRFNDYCSVGSKYFTITSELADADIALIPFWWKPDWWNKEVLKNQNEVAEKLVYQCKRLGKKILIFFGTDSVEDISVENSIVFRSSFYRSKKKSTEFAKPGWSIDFLKTYYNNKLILRAKSKVPTIGYCGYVDYNFLDKKVALAYHIKDILISIIKANSMVKPWEKLRGSAVRACLRSRVVDMKYVYRSSFSADTPLNRRMEYANNIMNTDYTIVTRGGGNFSYRLFEVLSCGRIPIFVDSDTPIPFDNIVDWKKYFVWVDERDVKYIPDVVDNFHKAMNNDEFVELQKTERKLYEEWIAPQGFFKNIWRCIVPLL